MRTRILLLVFVLLLVGGLGGGAWWYTSRREDPHARALLLAGRGEYRGLLIEQRNDVARLPNDAGVRMRLAATLLKLYDFTSAEKGFRAAGAAGAPPFEVAAALAETDMMQGKWASMLETLPATAPTPAETARLMLLRGTAQLGLKRIEAAKSTLAALDAVAPNGVDAGLLGARIAIVAQDLPAALARLDMALKADPKQPDALATRLRMETAPTPEALALADRARDAAPWSIDVRLQRANLLMLAGKNEAARSEVDWVRARYPNVPAGNYLNAVLLTREAKLPEALAALEKMGRSAELFPRALYLQAAIASSLGNRETAVELARRYNTRYPGDRAGVLLLARAELMGQRPGDAVPLLEKALAADGGTQDPAMLQLLGVAYSGLGQQAEAFRVRQEAASVAPDNPGALNGLGLSQLDRGDTSAGIDTLQRASKLAPIPPPINDRLFSAAVGAGDIESATAALARRRADEGETESVRNMEALLLLARGDVEGGRHAMEELVKAFPNSALAKVNLSKLLLPTDRRAEGEALLAAVLDKDRGNLPALTTAIQDWFGRKEYGKALAVVDAAQATAPADARYTAMRSDVLLRSGDARAAAAVIEERRVAGKLPAGLLPFLARAQVAAGDKAGAVKTYAEMIELSPTDPDIRLQAAGLLSAENRRDEAKAVVRAGIAQSPGTFSLMAALVTMDLRDGGPELAMKEARALQAEPRNRPASALLEGDLLMQQKQFAAAATAFRSEYDKLPSSILAMRVASAEVADGQLDKAAAVLRQRLAATPGDPDPDTAVALASLETRAKHWDQAAPLLEARLRRRPNEAPVLNDLAWVYLNQNDPRAQELAERAYQLMPVPQIADTLGWIVLKKGEQAKGLALLTSAHDKLPANPTLTYHLAVALQTDGKPAESLKLLQPLLAQPVAFDDRPAAEALAKQLQQ